MYLEGQGRQRGYAMAALLVALGVMAVLMSVALPVWRQQAQREKEAELVFRGEQYARAIGLYQRKTASFPTSLDVLVSQRFLRKKYKDPMTEDGEFVLIPASAVGGQNPQGGQNPGGQNASPGRGGQGSGGASGRIPPPAGSPQSAGSGGGFSLGAGLGGPFMGVQSKSKEASIRIYKGRTHYNEWQFLIAVSNRPGGGVGGVGPGGRGIGGPGGRGRGGPDGRGGDGRGRGFGPGDGREFGPGRGVPLPGGRGGRGGRG